MDVTVQSRGAMISFSIFIASMITSTSPHFTVCPEVTGTDRIVPCRGAVILSAPAKAPFCTRFRRYRRPHIPCFSVFCTGSLSLGCLAASPAFSVYLFYLHLMNHTVKYDPKYFYSHGFNSLSFLLFIVWTPNAHFEPMYRRSLPLF